MANTKLKDSEIKSKVKHTEDTKVMNISEIMIEYINDEQDIEKAKATNCEIKLERVKGKVKTAFRDEVETENGKVRDCKIKVEYFYQEAEICNIKDMDSGIKKECIKAKIEMANTKVTDYEVEFGGNSSSVSQDEENAHEKNIQTACEPSENETEEMNERKQSEYLPYMCRVCSSKQPTYSHDVPKWRDTFHMFHLQYLWEKIYSARWADFTHEDTQ